MRSISNVVDVTNYVMLELGQPFHAFDLDRIQGGFLRVRKARAGEPLTTLDGKARSLVERLDSMTPQVLIESRIVEASTSFSRSIGVQWGGFVQAAPASGNPTGLNFPSSARVTGGSDLGTASATGVSGTPNFAVNLPAAVGAGAGSGRNRLNSTLGRATGAGFLATPPLRLTLKPIIPVNVITSL